MKRDLAKLGPPEVNQEESMQQSTVGCNKAASSPHSAEPGFLRLVRVGKSVGEGNQYALIPLPDTYEDALEAAIEVLGRYMVDRTTKNIVLRGATRNIEGSPIWADIHPKSWKTMVQACHSELGVFDAPGDPSDEDEFMRGRLFVTVGTMRAGTTNWSELKEGIAHAIISSTSPHMTRPIDYNEAVILAKALFAANPSLVPGFSFRNARDDKDFRFYTFPLWNEMKTGAWKEIPISARNDGVTWRKFVPPPGGVIGIMIH